MASPTRIEGPEIRYAGTLEFRRDLRQVSGVIVPYGEMAQFRNSPSREMFLPGSLTPVGDVYLNAMHQNGQQGRPDKPLIRQSEGLELIDTDEAMSMTAILPETQAAGEAIDQIVKGIFRGLSIEFNSVRDEWRGGVRVVHRAELVGVGIVDSPAYRSAAVEVRDKGRRKLWL